MKLDTRYLVTIALVAIALYGCASSEIPAPVSDRHTKEPLVSSAPVSAIVRPASGDQDWRPQTYVVQKGDTLYGIAFNYGLDYHDLATLNNIDNPDVIKAGQELRLFPPQNNVISVKPAPTEEVVSVPLAKSEPLIQPAKQIGSSGIPVFGQPLALKLPYSADAAARIARQQTSVPQQPPVVIANAEPPKTEVKPVVPVPPVDTPAPDIADEDIEWAMPTSGKIIAGFAEGENRKGIDIAGKLGQPVLASAAGKVVYSGSGLRGYGKLIIIKHNKTYLSAYAHNDRILVKEGQSVTRGQKIAEMGNTDSNQVELHFEIRKLGKPVDPAKYLPLIKS